MQPLKLIGCEPYQLSFTRLYKYLAGKNYFAIRIRALVSKPYKFPADSESFRQSKDEAFTKKQTGRAGGEGVHIPTVTDAHAKSLLLACVWQSTYQSGFKNGAEIDTLVRVGELECLNQEEIYATDLYFIFS